MTASGTFGYGTEYASLLDVNELGAIVTKAISRQPRDGNPPPRTVETPSGMLNAIGWQNIGLNACLREYAPTWGRWNVPVIVNVAGFSIEEYAEVAEALASAPGVAAIELNISCPNVEGLPFALRPELAAEVTAAVRAVCDVPLICKLSPNVTDVVEIAAAVVAAGADAVSLINTLVGMVIDTRTRRPVLGNRTGGLSGPAVRPVAVRMVYEVHRALPDVPIIGAGGVMTTDDALQFIFAGARAVQVGTANFVNPRASVEIVAGLRDYLEREGVRDMSELVGAAHR
ncbi:MAG: dihydroorotate dehydrogenase [Chloroflexota bacterium]|nr:MAG: dihydroorotate dehydrogenase [Chloroflexota bacterium]